MATQRFGSNMSGFLWIVFSLATKLYLFDWVILKMGQSYVTKSCRHSNISRNIVVNEERCLGLAYWDILHLWSL
ncbi:hypothetical protein BDD12DRAFT_843259 [Trichophaea hybrida]|nr:hypothetical protein BDD12DRAFT_843259 [Trichophaea hybrida]